MTAYLAGIAMGAALTLTALAGLGLAWAWRKWG